MTSKQAMEILDMASDLFLDQTDVQTAIDEFVRGVISPEHLLERLVSEKERVLEYATRRVCGPIDIHELREERLIQEGDVIQDAREGA